MADREDEDEAMLARLTQGINQRAPAPSAKPKHRRHKRGKPYAQMYLKVAEDGFRALGNPASFVWTYVQYRAWADNNPTVPLPNEALATYGISRQVKWKALRRLEQAGLIRIETRSRKSPLITVLREVPGVSTSIDKRVNQR